MKIILMMTNQERETKMETHRHFMERMRKTVTTSGNGVVKDLIMKDINYILKDKYEFIFNPISEKSEKKTSPQKIINQAQQSNFPPRKDM
jgi:hypothetical protein